MFVLVQWPYGIQLTHREWEIIAYYHLNEIFVVDENKKVWLFDRRVLEIQYHQAGDSYPNPVYDDLVVGFKVRDRDYLDFCNERIRNERNNPNETPDNPANN